jgi:hypothetical protein
MSHKRLIALLCGPALVVAGLALTVASAPSAAAFCTIADQEAGLCPGGGGGSPTTSPPQTTPPTPPADLRPYYLGTVYGNGRSASAVMAMSGSAGAVSIAVSLAEGLHIDCHGDNAVGMVDFTMSGYRTSAGANGSSTYYLHREVSTTIQDTDVNLSLYTYATLSPDGTVLSGPLALHAGLPWYLSDCDASWSFSTHAM